MAEERKREKVFYSWQADVEAKGNRYFIEECLKKAIKAINQEGSLLDELILDRDTKGVPGSPVIAQTILGKIEESAVFVGDVTIIGHADSGKPITNPNVMIELGYALKALSHDALILVLNLAHGGIQHLPFDLRHRRVMTYNLPATAPGDGGTDREAKREVARGLERDLQRALREFFNKRHIKPVEPLLPPAEQLEQYLLDPNDARKAAKLIDKEIEKVSEDIVSISTSEMAKNGSSEGVYQLMQAYEGIAVDVLKIYVRGCYDGNDQALTEAMVRGLINLAHLPPLAHQFGSPHLYLALLLLYAGGMAALAGKRFTMLISLMHQVWVRTTENPKGYPAVYQLVPYRVIPEHIAKRIPPVEAHHTPISAYLFRVLREPLRPVIRTDAEYEECFLRFEYLFALASAFASGEYGWGIAAPVGSYIWEQNLRRPPYIFDVTDRELDRQKESWPPFKAGIFDGAFEDFLLSKRQADDSIKKQISRHYPML